jgi:parallel beta-helix repeat protein
MDSRGKAIVFAAAFVLLLASGIRLSGATGGLNCAINATCSSPSIPVVYLKNDTGGYWNAHIQNVSVGTYPYSICCNASTGSLGYDCAEATVLKLYAATNAHAQRGNYTGPGSVYTVSACLSATPGTAECVWGDSCGSDYECLGSMASSEAGDENKTNAHVGPCQEYQTKICCRVQDTVPPDIWFTSPSINGSTTSNNWIFVNVSANENLNACLLDWYNGTWQNVSMAVQGSYCYKNMTSLQGGSYYFHAYGNDAAGNWNVTEDREARVTTYVCENCSDCSNKIAKASSGDTIQLNTSLANQNVSGTCISFGGKDNLTFDCLGNTIDGDDTDLDYGIWLNQTGDGSNNNTIRNCVVTDFAYGLYLQSSSSNALTNITANSNSESGLGLLSSSGNGLTNIVSNENLFYGLYLGYSSNNTLQNIIANSNSNYGLIIQVGSNNTLRSVNITTNASASQGGLFAVGSPSYRNDIDNTVMVDGKPVQYFDGQHKACPDDQVLDYNNTYSQVAFVACNNVTLNATGITDAVYLFYTNNSKVYNVNSSYNYYGLLLWFSSNNSLSNITASYNLWRGLYLESSSNNALTNIIAGSNSDEGLLLSSSSNNTLSNITANSNTGYGLYLSSSSNYNTLQNVTASSNSYGIYLLGLFEYNTINDSRIENNTNYGIYLESFDPEYPRWNTFYNNFLNNTVNLYSDSANNLNYWNVSMDCTKTSIIGGPCIGGNYWTNSSATGFSDMCTDGNGDGICDANYTAATNNTDYLPLSEKPPQLIFTSPTLSNLSVTGNNWIYVNVSANQTLNWCTLNWYNGTWQNVSAAATGRYCYVNMTGLASGSYYFRVYGNDTLGKMNVTEDRQVTFLPMQVQNTRLISPSLLVARNNETMNSTTFVKYTQGENAVYMANITSEVPWDFGAPSAGDVRVYFVDYAPYGRRDITGNASVDIQVVDQSGTLPTLVMVNISSLWLTAAGGNMSVNDSIEVFYLMTSSRMEPNEYRSVYTNSTLKDNLSQTGSSSIMSRINSSEVVLRGDKRIWIPDLSNPQLLSGEIAIKAIGGPVSGILLSDYLPQGAELTGLNVTYYNQTMGSTLQLVNGSDYYVAEPVPDTLPDGTYVDVYYYNFSYKYTNWDGNLYDNDSITITYNVSVLGGGQWVLPAIIAGWDPTYKKSIVTETSGTVNVPLFDVAVDLITKTVPAGGVVKAVLKMLNVGGPRARVDVAATYAVKTAKGEVVTEATDTFAVTDQKEMELGLEIPKETPSGRYNFEVLATYVGREAISARAFDVVAAQPLEGGTGLGQGQNFIFCIAGAIIVIVLIAASIFRRRRHIEN